MAFLEWLCSKRAVALAAAAAVALGVGMVATPDEAAAQCTIINEDSNTDVDTFEDLRTDTLTFPDEDDVAVDCTDSITTDDIVNGTIDGEDIGNGEVDTLQLADDAVEQDKIADDAVGSAQIQENAVTASELADDSVDTAAIQDSAVTTEKIADDAVTWDKLAPGVRNRIDENSEGVAIALALQNPDLVGNETFGLSVNWGGFESSNALGIAATGVLGTDVFGAGDRLAIAGGVGFGFDEDTVGGRVGAQLSW